MAYYRKKSITWSFISSSYFGARYSDTHAIFDVAGSSAFPGKDCIFNYTAYMCSSVAHYFMKLMNPTLNFQVGNVSNLPVPSQMNESLINDIANELIKLHKNDWNSFESAWEFKRNPLLNECGGISEAYSKYVDKYQLIVKRCQKLECDNNIYFSSLFNIKQEIETSIPVEAITLKNNPAYRYPEENVGSKLKERYQSDISVELISYTIGCQMGRYSLDREGLVYAHEGNKGFADLVAEGAYKTFPADSDGILPLMDDEWFEDDVTSRVKEFVRTVWGEEHLQENLEFIAESLCLYAIKPKKGESALETIRRYLSTQFWKDHLKMYKKRPIYWLFSSGKEKAFECLVYLHRYNDATLPRMRTEYVVPLLARYQANIDRLNDQLDEASGGEATRLKRERDSLIKKFSELRSYDDRLRHYADMRISIDLDDGVKVNYGKFGDLLADVKAITGNAPEVI